MSFQHDRMFALCEALYFYVFLLLLLRLSLFHHELLSQHCSGGRLSSRHAL